MKLPKGVSYTNRELRRKGLCFILTHFLCRELPFSIPDGNGIDAQGRVWFTIRNNRMRMSQAYAWNGSSPKRYWLGLFWGTPDFSATILPTLWHDVFFQFSYALRHYVTMIQVNDLFHYDLRVNRFIAADLWHDAVVEFGHKYWGIQDDNVQYVLL